MIKKFKAAVLITGLTVSMLSVGSTAFCADEPLSLSITSAVNMAYERNLDYKTSALNLKSAELSLTETEANNLSKPSPTGLLQAKTNLLIAQKNYDTQKTDLMINVSDAYFGLIKADNLIVVNENALKSSKDNLQIVETKLKSGVASQLDLIRQEADLTTKEGNLDRAKKNRDLALLKLSQLLRLPADTDVILTTQPSYDEVKYNLDADIAKALNTRTEIIQAQATVELRKTDLALSINDYTAGVTQEKSKIELEKAEISLEQAKDRVISEIKQNYINLVDSYNRILSSEKNLAAAKETLRVTELKFKANMATNSEVIEAQNSVTSSSTDLESAIFDFQVANIRYLKSVGTDYEIK